MFEEDFGKLGLNENEQEVYLAVLKAGKVSPQRVAKLTGVNRTTVYSIVRKLAGLGLLHEDLGSKVQYLSAESPEAFGRLIDREQRAVEEKKKAARRLTEELAAFGAGKHYSVPRIKFVEERDLSDYLYQRYPAWAESGARRDNTWWGYHDHSCTETYGQWIDWSWKQPPRGVSVRFFTNAADSERKMKEKHPDRLVKVLSDSKDFDSSMWVIGDYTIMVQTRERPHYLVEIHDSVFSRNQRQLFKTLWEKD
ncbi:hypothetical protein HY416_03085 [Candidatus Kaiserbacteria bacterium]|nr:hypothetical protein [Candidatus Kaiserbacteria bacterium]